MNDPNPHLIEQNFIESWYQMEKYYENILRQPRWGAVVRPLLDLIRVMRAKGYDKHLRAGQSMFTFIVSRSIKHGLRLDQACIAFGPDFNGSLHIECTFDGIRTEHHFDHIEWNDELRHFLDRLVREPLS